MSTGAVDSSPISARDTAARRRLPRGNRLRSRCLLTPCQPDAVDDPGQRVDLPAGHDVAYVDHRVQERIVVHR